MAGNNTASVPCMRCKTRRVKCDKRQPGCVRCEKSSRQCPGYNRVRKFLDEGENLRHKIIKNNSSRGSGSNGSSNSHQSTRRNTSASADSHDMKPNPQGERSTSLQERPAETNGAGVLFRSMNENSLIADSDGKSDDTSTALGQGTQSITTTTLAASFVDLDFEAAYFDIDPQVYYADPNNCCLLIPAASQAEDDEFLDLQHSSASSILTPSTDAWSAQSQDRSCTATEGPDDDEEHEASYLIRYFAEFTSQWLDIFAVERFFGNVVPVRALHSALLKNSMAAVTAKQFGSLRKEAGALSSSSYLTRTSSHQYRCRSTLDMHLTKSSREWFYKAAIFYDKAIGQMMMSWQALRYCCSSGQPFPPRSTHDSSPPSLMSQFFAASPQSRPQMPLDCEKVADELLAAMSVFLLYELLDNRQAELVQHMKGARCLLMLNTDQVQQLCYGPSRSCATIPSSLSPTKAWQSMFWNFAWVDYVVAYTRHCAPQLDTQNGDMWKAAGLPLCKVDGKCFPESLRGAGLDPPKLMTETTSCQALLWIILDTLNYIVSTEEACEDCSNKDSHHSPDSTQQHHSRATAPWSEHWHLIRQHLESWNNALPPTFEPCVSVQAYDSRRQLSTETTRPTAVPPDIPEIYFYNPMCAATTLLYHFTQILLLIHKPVDPSWSTSSSQSATRRLHTQRQLSNQIDGHARQICAIALGQSTLAVRMHMTYPLYLAGLCLQTQEQRLLLADLLVGIQRDTGYSTEWTVAQLEEEWGWQDINRPETQLGRSV